ncbi:MAG: hypothetical protein NQU46_02555 [Methanolinea sp.]|nr:hypothetical protein [Methanolinea sp.]
MTRTRDGDWVFCGLEQAIEGNDRVTRRRLLSRLVQFLSSTDSAAPAFISGGGVRLLLAAALDRDEEVRIPALNALSWLVDAGYAEDIVSAGGLPLLRGLQQDEALPVRQVASRIMERLGKV